MLSSVSYDLTGQYIEKLTVTGTRAIDATGNSFDNVLIGNAAANRLDGMKGVDEMRGGKGNDTYVVGQVGDKAYELKDEGIDTVLSSVSYDLTGQYIETLTLTGTSIDQRHRQLARQCPDREQRGQSCSTGRPVSTRCTAAPATTRTSSARPATRPSS